MENKINTLVTLDKETNMVFKILAAKKNMGKGRYIEMILTKHANNEYKAEKAS